jgi:hypothetical protein
MAVVLANPIVTTVTDVAVTFVHFALGPTDAQTVGTLGYAPSDASGNLLPQATPTAGQVVVILAAADVAAFNANPGSVRMKAEAALQSNLGAASVQTIT